MTRPRFRPQETSKVPGEGARQRVLLSPSAKTDILETLAWSREKFGKQAAARYRRLLDQAIRDIAADPECPGSCAG